MDPSISARFLLVLFPFFFVGLWCTVLWLLSVIGGWHRLAGAFPARNPPSGRRYSMQGAKMGMVNYNGCLTIHSSSEGLYLSVWFPFRIGHPPLFIPWEAVRNAKPRRFLWAERVVFDAGSPVVATLRLSKQVFEGHPVVL